MIVKQWHFSRPATRISGNTGSKNAPLRMAVGRFARVTGQQSTIVSNIRPNRGRKDRTSTEVAVEVAVSTGKGGGHISASARVQAFCSLRLREHRTLRSTNLTRRCERETGLASRLVNIMRGEHRAWRTSNLMNIKHNHRRI